MYVNRKNRDAFRYRYIAAHWAHTHTQCRRLQLRSQGARKSGNTPRRSDGRTVLRRVDAMLDIVTTNRPC